MLRTAAWSSTTKTRAEDIITPLAKVLPEVMGRIAAFSHFPHTPKTVDSIESLGYWLLRAVPRHFPPLCGEQIAKLLNCVRGRIPQARDPDCGLNPCSAETGSVRWREAGSCDNERDCGCDSMGRRDYEVTCHGEISLH